ncbi:MAG: TetR/AcrR family transcriptional regulator [Candidatus Dormibacteria bacterium]
MSRRSYNSPRRAASAQATRAAVVEAADELFGSGGYAGTTLASIAERAGVSVATVKLIAPTKSALLLEAFRARVRGVTGSAAASGRPAWQEMLEETDPVQLIRRWISLTASAHARMAPLFEVFWQAGPSEPELARMYEEASSNRRQEFGRVVDALAGLGALRVGLDAAAAIDIAWVINSPLTYRQVMGCGWTKDDWEEWLVPTMVDQLLAPVA